jgi:hypothetical protein
MAALEQHGRCLLALDTRTGDAAMAARIDLRQDGGAVAG